MKCWHVYDLSHSFNELSFCSRSAAINWLKLYGKEWATYKLFRGDRYPFRKNIVTVANGFVYFVDPFVASTHHLGCSAESKKTAPFTIRNS